MSRHCGQSYAFSFASFQRHHRVRFNPFKTLGFSALFLTSHRLMINISSADADADLDAPSSLPSLVSLLEPSTLAPTQDRLVRRSLSRGQAVGRRRRQGGYLTASQAQGGRGARAVGPTTPILLRPTGCSLLLHLGQAKSASPPGRDAGQEAVEMVCRGGCPDHRPARTWYEMGRHLKETAWPLRDIMPPSLSELSRETE